MPVTIPFHTPSIDEDEIAAVAGVMRSGWLTMGKKTFEFEAAIGKYTDANHVVAVNSCTAALHLSLLASEIGPGDEVITTPLTFASTGNVIVHTGAKPILSDIDAKTYNIDPEKINEVITSRTKAIIPVHYAGLPCDMRAINEIAEDNGLIVIEDAAHAIGASKNGIKIGNSQNPTCFSFYATKNITTGEGGAVTTNDERFADKIKKMRLHGISKDAWNRYGGGSWKYDIGDCGWKYNTTDINSAIGVCQLRKLDSFNSIRKKYAMLYTNELSSIDGIQTPLDSNGDHIYHLYPLLVPKEHRDSFIATLGEWGISCSVHFIPLHLHSFYQRQYGFKNGDFPVTESVYEREVSLPLYPNMTTTEVDCVIGAVKRFMRTIS